MYHQVGASLYRRISFMWMSGFSWVLLLYCLQMVFPWCRYVYTMREAMEAKDKPYAMAKVVLLPVSGELGQIWKSSDSGTHLRNRGE